MVKKIVNAWLSLVFIAFFISFRPASDFTTESCCHFLVHHWPGYSNCNKLLWLCCNGSEVIPSLLYNTLYRYRQSQQIWELSSIARPLQCFACKLSFSSGYCCRIPWGKLFSRIYCCGFFEYLRVNQWPAQVKKEAVNSWGITVSYQEFHVTAFTVCHSYMSLKATLLTACVHKYKPSHPCCQSLWIRSLYTKQQLSWSV